MNGKAFFFSIDAIIAAVAILMLVGMWAFTLQVNENENVINSLDRKSQDKAVVNFYKGVQGNESIGAAKEFGACNNYYKYENGNLVGQKFCEEM